MDSVLIPIAAAAYRQNDEDWYGAVELEVDTKTPVWKFDSTQSEFRTAEIYSSGGLNKHRGFRPASVQRLDGGLTLIAGWRRAVWVDEDGDVVRSEDHELMNDVHEVQKTDKGTYLVASTGTDVVLEFDEDWNEIWRWEAWKYLPEASRPRGYYPHKLESTDARDLAFSPDVRYHINYATYIDDDVILVSALNYGFFTISRNTGEVLNQNTSVDECHNPYSLGDDFVVSESGKDRVILADWKDTKDVMFKDELEFVKDADPIPGSDSWLVTNTKKSRVHIWNPMNDNPDKTFVLAENAKPYEADYLQGGDSNA